MTLIGILFSIVLVAVQLGLYLGARSMIIAMIDRADGDLWIMAYGTKNFEEAQPIRARERYAALATPGVVSAMPLVTAFTDWRKPTGGSTLVVVIGADAEDGGLAPWNVVEGDVSGTRRARCGDRRQDLSGANSASRASVTRPRSEHRACASSAHRGHPLVHRDAVRLHDAQRARDRLLDMPADNITYVLVKVAPGADIEKVRDDIRAKLPDSEVLTKAEFRDAQHQPLDVLRQVPAWR